MCEERDHQEFNMNTDGGDTHKQKEAEKDAQTQVGVCARKNEMVLTEICAFP